MQSLKMSTLAVVVGSVSADMVLRLRLGCDALRNSEKYSASLSLKKVAVEAQKVVAHTPKRKRELPGDSLLKNEVGMESVSKRVAMLALENSPRLYAPKKSVKGSRCRLFSLRSYGDMGRIERRLESCSPSDSVEVGGDLTLQMGIGGSSKVVMEANPNFK